MDLYTQNILEHYKNPRNSGSLAGADVSHHEANLSCGDKLSVDLKLTDSRVGDFKFSGGGCAISQASISILGEQIVNKTTDEVLELSFEDIKKYLGVPVGERRARCALLGLMTVQNAILKKAGRQVKRWSDYEVT